MTIDFDRPGLRLGYLIRGEYRDESGAAKVLRLCGPRAVVGRSVVLGEPGLGPVPGYLWEGRCAGADFDEDLGGLDQNVQALSDLTLAIELGQAGNDWTSAGREDELREDAQRGYWANHRVVAWLFDVDHPTRWQTVLDGRWDRNPTGIREQGFSLVAAGWILDPALRVPGTRLPEDESGWTNTTSEATNWRPAVYLLPSFKARQFRGPAIGDAGGSTTDFIWLEIVPYGWRNAPGTRIWFAHVSAIDGLYVHNIAFVDTLGEVIDVAADISGALIYTFVNTDPASGPIGTNVRFPGDAPSSTFNPGDVIDRRVLARVSGYGSGDNVHAILGAPFRGNTTPSVRWVWAFLEDLFEDPRFLGLANVWGTNAIADFAAQAPMGPFSYWAYGLCAIPPEVAPDPPEIRKLLAGMLRPVGADLVQRWDAAAEELRLYPIWRGPRPGQVAKVIRDSELLVRHPPSIVLSDDPDGIYANRIRVKAPVYFAAPIGDPDHRLPAETNFDTVRHDPVEQSAARFDGTREGEVEWDLWQSHGSSGFTDAASYAERERSQRQYTHIAQGNHRLMTYQMGDVIRYEVGGVYDAGGQVRGRRLNLEEMTVTLRSVHIEVHTRSGGRRGEK